jgi:cystathionine beta-lyase/cystathionine gamma-synthase
MDLSYIINELGEEREHYFNAVAAPIIQTSNFIFNKVDDMGQAFHDEFGCNTKNGYLYSRGVNPTVDILRKKLAALDGAEDCLVFNSGAAAIFAGVLANVKAGDHIISVNKPYSWAQHMFDVVLPRFNISTTYIDGTELKNFETAIQPNTSFIYLESPNSWEFQLQDLEGVSRLAQAHNIVTLCDNSYCSPLYQQPLVYGIDIAMQTATKYISGHSDTLGGVLCGSKEMMSKIFNSEYLCIGSGIQPFNAWLLIRGLRTLPARFDKITKTTTAVLAYLKYHSQVDEVIFPLDKAFKQIELANRQMKGACGLITFTLKNADRKRIVLFCESLRHIKMAVSWGGHESLVIPKCAGVSEAEFDPGNRQHRLIRLYVGLEDSQYLIHDLDHALSVCYNK